MGFKTDNMKYRDYSAKKLVYVESTPRKHPYFANKMRELMKVKHTREDGDYIVFIKRNQSVSYNKQRFITNEEDVIKLLRSIYGDRLIEFLHSEYSVKETFKLFNKAKAIIGSHGGGMYNQYFAPNDTVIIELMPIKDNGLYHGQYSKSQIPPFAHMAIWSNSNLIGQKFYRFYQKSKSTYYTIDIEKFKAFLQNIPELSILSNNTEPKTQAIPDTLDIQVTTLNIEGKSWKIQTEIIVISVLLFIVISCTFLKINKRQRAFY